MVVVPVALMALVLLNPFRSGGSETAVPDLRPTAPVTAAPVERTDKPARAERTTSAGSSAPSATPVTTPARSAPTTTTTTPVPTTPSASTTPTTVTASKAPTTPAPTVVPSTSPADVVYQNCAEVRAAGKAPLHRGDPGYSSALDRNGDGVACERGNS
jgi:hypothetical protein